MRISGELKKELNNIELSGTKEPVEIKLDIYDNYSFKDILDSNQVKFLIDNLTFLTEFENDYYNRVLHIE